VDGKIERLVRDLLEEAEKAKLISLILFGSQARGEATKDSDVDLFVICKRGEDERLFTDSVFNLEQKYGVRIEVMYFNEDVNADPYLLEKILCEGMVLYGKMPEIQFSKLGLKPFELIKYDLRKLDQKAKMRLKAQLYGRKTVVKYKQKKYVTEKIGLVEAIGGIRTGIASIMVPTKAAARIMRALETAGASFSTFGVWNSG
jgi:predicted nucleotidyltransferase